MSRPSLERTDSSYHRMLASATVSAGCHHLAKPVSGTLEFSVSVPPFFPVLAVVRSGHAVVARIAISVVLV